jgi:hypothetical protein
MAIPGWTISECLWNDAVQHDAERMLQVGGFQSGELMDSALTLLQWACSRRFLHPWMSQTSNKGGLRLVLHSAPHPPFSPLSLWVEGTPPGNANEPVLQVHLEPERRRPLQWHDPALVNYPPFTVGIPQTAYWARSTLRNVIDRVIGSAYPLTDAPAAELHIRTLCEDRRLALLLEGIDEVLFN